MPKEMLESYYNRAVKDIPQGSYPAYDYSALREFLYPAYQQSKGRKKHLLDESFTMVVFFSVSTFKFLRF